MIKKIKNYKNCYNTEKGRRKEEEKMKKNFLLAVLFLMSLAICSYVSFEKGKESEKAIESDIKMPNVNELYSGNRNAVKNTFKDSEIVKEGNIYQEDEYFETLFTIEEKRNGKNVKKDIEVKAYKNTEGRTVYKVQELE